MKKLVIASVLLSFISGGAFAVAPSCNSGPDGYCQYTGKVKRIYVNANNLIILYFESPVSVETASNAGINITDGSGAAFQINTNPEFAKLFYSTALAAQASGRNVTIQMRGNEGPYLKFDRIWLSSD
ncbi:hypothetical protein [Aliikangiella sp. IMCC44359]|uniref:hypothetical protein n=1 Tax=Aliikangiella sp. IMCC44359 TaxID=3459125 RepID=UPI00403B019E